MEIIRKSEENVAKLVTRNGEEGDLRMRDQDVTPETAGLEESQHATPAETENTSLPPR